MRRGPVRPLERVLANVHRHHFRFVMDGTVQPDTIVKRCIHCSKTVVRRKEPAA